MGLSTENPMRSFCDRFLTGLVALGLASCLAAAPAPQKKATPAQPRAAQAPAKPDINSAWQVELEKVPGISRVLAKKIIANRPYDSVDDLTRAGVPKDTIEKIRPLVRCDNSAHMPMHGGPPPKLNKTAGQK